MGIQSSNTKAAAKETRTIIYTFRGQIERGADYHWVDGYSETIEGRVVYPWMTKGECQSEAKQQGKRAIFIRN